MQTIRVNSRIRRYALLLLLVALFLGSARSAYAAPVMLGDAVGADELIENDVVLNGDLIVVDGEIDGDLVAVGRTVQINGTVTGSLLVIAETLIIGGNVGGSAYSLAVNLQLWSSAVISHSLYFVGISLTSDPGSQVVRDMNGLSLGARFSRETGRSANMIVGPIELFRVIMDRVNETTTGIPLGTAPPALELAYRSGGEGTPGGVLFQVEDDADSDPAATGDGLAQVVKQVRYFVTLFLVGALSLWLAPKRTQLWAERVMVRPLVAFASGIVVYIVGFAGVILLGVLFVGIALGFFALTLSQLGGFFLVSSLLLLGLAFTAFLFLVSLGSKVIVAYMLGQFLFRRFYAAGLRYRLVPLALGILLYVLVAAIPYVGWAVAMIVTFMGLGAVWLVYNDGRNFGALPAQPAVAA